MSKAVAVRSTFIIRPVVTDYSNSNSRWIYLTYKYIFVVGIYPRAGFEGALFKGFLVSAVDKTTGEAVGTMRETTQTSEASTPTHPAIKQICHGTSLTHKTNNLKEEVFFQWKAPDNFPQQVVELR